MNELKKLAVFKKKGEKGFYYAVYQVDKVGDKNHYTLIGFMSEYQILCALNMEVK